MFVAKSKFPLNDLPEMQVHRFRDENESCDFGQLTFPIMKANCEPELPEMLKLSLKVTSTFLNPDNTFRCTVPEIRNDFAVDLSRFETFFEALEHSPLGKKKIMLCHVASSAGRLELEPGEGVCHFWVSLKAGIFFCTFLSKKNSDLCKVWLWDTVISTWVDWSLEWHGCFSKNKFTH